MRCRCAAVAPGCAGVGVRGDALRLRHVKPPCARFGFTIAGPTMTLALLVLILPASANDLRGRVGFGFHAGLGSVSALSARYALPTSRPEVNVQVELDAGVAIAEGAEPQVVAGGRGLYGVVAEDNLSLYAAAGAFYVQDPERSRVRIQPAVGAQFFFFGLENLGFGVEWGLNLDLGDEPAIQTISGAPAVTVHYWF